jgi:hypothetical protein
MPQPVGHAVQAALVIALAHLPILVDIRDVGDMRVQPLFTSVPTSPSSSPKLRLNATCSSTVIRCSGNTSTAYSSIPPSTAAISAALSSGYVVGYTGSAGCSIAEPRASQWRRHRTAATATMTNGMTAICTMIQPAPESIRLRQAYWPSGTTMA